LISVELKTPLFSYEDVLSARTLRASSSFAEHGFREGRYEISSLKTSEFQLSILGARGPILQPDNNVWLFHQLVWCLSLPHV
jgi:hypothetical protein